jgi:NAD(P)-dependent dehydrogenase (short-subunit alcohol dehydrogenase family)
MHRAVEAASRREFLASGAAVAVPLSGSAPAASATWPVPGLLAGKNAVIYGAAGAMGSAVSRVFAREGAQVFLAGRTLEKVDALAREIVDAGGVARAASVDAQDRAAVEKHLGELVRQFGAIDISFNLIGINDTQGALLTDMNVDSFSRPIVNAMRTQYLTATTAARYMSQRRSGVLLALTAQVARKPYSGSGGFGVACAAIEGLWRQLAVELGPSGVRLVTLRSSGSPDAPGVSEAIALHARDAGVSREAFEARISEKTMLKRMPRMAEVANAAVLAASDRASAITAAVMNITCGEIAD